MCSSKTKHNPLVSVVVPTRNRSGYLQDSLQSVLDQTYSDLEIIVVDDASTDDTINILESLQEKDKRVSYVSHEWPSGASAARNTALKKASGAFIAFQDDDDIWDHEKLEKQLAVFKQNLPEHVWEDPFTNDCTPGPGRHGLGVVYCRACSFDENGIYFQRKGKMPEGNIYRDQLPTNYVSTQTALVRKACFDMVGLFDTNLISRNDHDMFLRIAYQFDFKAAPEFLVMKRAHFERLSDDVESKKKGWEAFLGKWCYPKQVPGCAREYRRLFGNYHLEMTKIYFKNKRRGIAAKHFLKGLTRGGIKISDLARAGRRFVIHRIRRGAAAA